MLLIQSPLIISGRKNKIVSGVGSERVYERYSWYPDSIAYALVGVPPAWVSSLSRFVSSPPTGERRACQLPCHLVHKVCVAVIVVSSLRRVRLFATPWCLSGSSVCGVLQARILKCVAISSSRGSSQPRD